MSNADINAEVLITKINSESAEARLKNDINKILENLKLDFNTNSLNKALEELSKIAEKAAIKMSVKFLDTLTGKLKNYNIDQKGIIRDSFRGRPSKFDQIYSGQMYLTRKFAPGPSEKPNTLKGTFFTEDIVEPIIKFAKTVGSSAGVIEKLMRNFPSAVSGLTYEEKSGKYRGSVNLGSTQVGFSGGGVLIGNQIIPSAPLSITDISYSADKIGKGQFNEAMAAQKSLPSLREALKDVESQMSTVVKDGEEYNSLLKTQQTLLATINRLETKIADSEKEITAAQKKKIAQVKQSQEIKSQEKEATEQIKASQKEQNNAYKDSLSLLSQIDKLTKQNIQYSDSSKSKELVNINNVKLESLRKEYELKKAMLSPEDKSKLAAKEKAKFTEQNMKAVEKTLKLQSTKGSRGNFMDETRTAISRVATYGMAYKSIGYLQNAIKGTLDKLIEFDKYMTSLQIVTRENDAETKKLLASYIQLGKEVGASTQQVVEAADTWLRQGRSVADTNELIRATMVMANIAQIDSAKSADILTSALNGFKLEAKDAMSVVDMFAAVDLAAAADTEELAEALQRVAATAGEAGLSIETTTSYIGTLLDATRLDAGSIGSALNTIISRFENIKLNNLAEGSDTLSDAQKALRLVGIELFDVTGSFKDIDTILGELASKWGALNDVEKSSIAYAVAGVRQRNIFLSLMNNWDKSLYLSATALNAEGTAMEKQADYMDSYEAKMKQLRDTIDSFVHSGFDANWLKGIASGLTGLINGLNSVGLNLKTILATLAGIAGATKGSTLLQRMFAGFGKGGRGGSKKQIEYLSQSSIFTPEEGGKSVSELQNLQSVLVKMGKNTRASTKALDILADKSGQLTVAGMASLNEEAKARLKFYNDSKLSANEAIQIEQNLAAARIATGKASWGEQWKASGGWGRAGMIVGAVGKVAGYGLAAYQLISGVVEAIQKKQEERIREIAKQATESISTALEKASEKSLVSAQQNFEELQKIASQASEGSFSAEMSEQLNTIIENLQKQTGISIEALEKDENGNYTLKSIENIVKDYQDVFIEKGGSGLTEESKELLKETEKARNKDYSAFLPREELAEMFSPAEMKEFLPFYSLEGVISTLEEEIKSEGISEGEKSKLKERLEELKKTKEEIDKALSQVRSEYFANLSLYGTSYASQKVQRERNGKVVSERRISQTVQNTIDSIMNNVVSGFSEEQLQNDELAEAMKKDYVKMIDYLAGGGSFDQLATDIKEGKYFSDVKLTDEQINKALTALAAVAPRLVQAASALKNSIDDLNDTYKRQLKAAEVESAMLGSLATLGGDLDMSKGDILSMLNIGGKADTSKILDPAFQKYAKELTDLYEEYWGENGKIANATYLETQDQLNEEYERAVNLKQKEYEILKKQLEVQKAQNQLEQAQRERDTLVFRNGRFIYEANPTTIQELKQQQEQLQKEQDQLEIQKAIADHTTGLQDYFNHMQIAADKIATLLEGDLTQKTLEGTQLSELIKADLEKGGGKLTDPFLIALWDAMNKLTDDEKAQLAKWGIFADEQGKFMSKKPYDTGGLLEGQGLFKKQSIGDEVVLSPTDAPKILSLLSRTSEFQSTVENANSLLRTLGARDGKPEGLLSALANGTTNIFNVDNVNVEEANDIEGILLSAQQKVQMTNPRFIRG